MVGGAGGSVVWSGPGWCALLENLTSQVKRLLHTGRGDKEATSLDKWWVWEVRALPTFFFFFLVPSSLTENLRFSWVFFFLVFSPAGSAVCLEVEQKSALRFAYSILIWSLWKSFRKLGRTRESRFRAEPSVEDSPQRVVWFRRLAWSVSSCDQSRQQTMV